MTIHAIYEKGVFRPTQKVDFPDRCEVELVVLPVGSEPAPEQDMPMTAGLAKVYEILGRQHSSGYTDTAERHNEHQP